MTTLETQKTILRLLKTIAPEADVSNLKPDVPFRDQLDLDSMDLLNLVIALHKEFNVEIPEAEYGKMATLEGCAAYLEARLAAIAK